MTQNDLYELVADFGIYVCCALRRDHYLARMIDPQGNWDDIKANIGSDRVALLKDDPSQATDREFKSIIDMQIRNALESQNPDTTPTIWLCERDSGTITMIEGWGEEITVELRFHVIGHYPSRDSALDDLHHLYFIPLPLA